MSILRKEYYFKRSFKLESVGQTIMKITRINWKTLIALVLTSAFWLPQGSIFAQSPKVCGTDILLQQRLSTPEGRRIQADIDRQLREWVDLYGGQRATATYVIPTVVHIIQETSTDLISDQCVQSQIDILNEDFQKLNADTSVVPMDLVSLVTNSDIEFCLATKDPMGNPTTGITRTVNTTHANHNMGQGAAMKALIQWDPSKYFNLWVPATISGGILGYATFPGGNAAEDGVVVNGTYFGDASCSSAPYNLGRTATHEVGHWLGLYHTFQDGCAGMTAGDCATAGDQICDTPPTASANFGCPSGTQNTCSESPNDLIDMTVNYMDYGDDACLVMFSHGQRDRMHGVLNSSRASLVTQQNNSDAGCGCSVQAPCNPSAAFQANNFVVCPGQTVTFNDQSTGPISSWSWTFAGGIPATSTAQNPTVTYPFAGNYDVVLAATNSLGTSTVTATGYVQVVAGVNPPIAEGFETTFPSTWQLINDDNAGTWLLTNTGSQGSAQCIFMDNWSNAAGGSVDAVSTNIIDLSTYTTGELTFDYAYKQAFPLTDTLEVYLSSDCGETWNLEWAEGGSNLASVGGVAQTPWVPAAEGDWENVSIDLTNYLGNSGFKARFDNIGYKSNLFLDNINISALVNSADPTDGPLWTMDVRPNPSANAVTLAYQLPKKADLSISLVDLNGRVVYRKDLPNQTPGSHTLALPQDMLDQLGSGVYFLRGEGSLGHLVKKLVRID